MNHVFGPVPSRRLGRSLGVGVGHSLARSLEPEMSPNLLKGRFNGPAGREPTDNLCRGEAQVRGVDVVVSMSALDVVDVDPADRDDSLSGLVPVTGAGDELHAPRPPAVLTDGGANAPTVCDDLFRREPRGFPRRRRSVEVGVAVKPADLPVRCTQTGAMPLLQSSCFCAIAYLGRRSA